MSAAVPRSMFGAVWQAQVCRCLLSLAEGASTETNHRTYACHILEKAAAI